MKLTKKALDTIATVKKAQELLDSLGHSDNLVFDEIDNLLTSYISDVIIENE
jgi:hypothetical protein